MTTRRVLFAWFAAAAALPAAFKAVRAAPPSGLTAYDLEAPATNLYPVAADDVLISIDAHLKRAWDAHKFEPTSILISPAAAAMIAVPRPRFDAFGLRWKAARDRWVADVEAADAEEA